MDCESRHGHVERMTFYNGRNEDIRLSGSTVLSSPSKDSVEALHKRNRITKFL
jgi:hypothetical protein